MRGHALSDPNQQEAGGAGPARPLVHGHALDAGRWQQSLCHLQSLHVFPAAGNGVGVGCLPGLHVWTDLCLRQLRLQLPPPLHPCAQGPGGLRPERPQHMQEQLHEGTVGPGGPCPLQPVPVLHGRPKSTLPGYSRLPVGGGRRGAVPGRPVHTGRMPAGLPDLPGPGPYSILGVRRGRPRPLPVYRRVPGLHGAGQQLGPDASAEIGVPGVPGQLSRLQLPALLQSLDAPVHQCGPGRQDARGYPFGRAGRRPGGGDEVL